MKRLVILLIILPLTLSGCWDQKIFEKIGFTLQTGVENSKKEGEYLITHTSPSINAKDKYGIEMISTTADILRESRENADRMASRKMEGGKEQQILFSDEVAKDGIHEFLEIFHRDNQLPVIAWVAVVEGSPHEMFEKASKFKDIPGPALYINQLIENGTKDLFAPETRVYDFNINYFAPGSDPITPLLKLETEDIVVVGSAVFSDDKMVGKLDHNQTSMLVSMMGRARNSRFSYIDTVPPEMSPDGKKKFAISMTGTKRKIDVNIEDGKTVVNITLKFKAYMEEFGWDNLNNEAVQEKIEKQLEESIKKDCLEVLNYLQKVGSDPIGIGEIVRAKYYDFWNSIDWKSAYKDTEFNVDVDVDIKEFGAID